jgi:hypothetical protein
LTSQHDEAKEKKSLLSKALNSLPTIIEEEFFEKIKVLFREMLTTITVEEKSHAIPASLFRPRVARAIWHITFGGDIPYPGKIPSMDRDGTPRDEVIDNILYVTAGDAVRTYYFKEGYGPDFMRAELSST